MADCTLFKEPSTLYLKNKDVSKRTWIPGTIFCEIKSPVSAATGRTWTEQ